LGTNVAQPHDYASELADRQHLGVDSPGGPP
jgi:hypothetical protein